MKKQFFFALCFFTLFSSAQIRVYNNGISVFGEAPSNVGNINSSDSVTICRMFPTTPKATSRISFGNYFAGQIPGVSIGDYKHNSYRLNAFGLLGFNFATMANDTLAYFDMKKGNYFQFNCDVRSSGLFISSDKRFKQDIEYMPSSIEGLSQLKAISYKYKINQQKRKAVKSSNSESLDSASLAAKKTIDDFYTTLQNEPRRFGFLAQDVKEVYPELVRTDSAGYMYVDYVGMIPLLVNAINELTAKLYSLEAIVSEQPKDNTSVRTMRAKSNASIGDTPNITECTLFQNIPNPFDTTTEIKFYINPNVQKATILITDLQGSLKLEKVLTQRGLSTVNISANELSAGVYLYTLIADSKIIDSKRMCLTLK